MTVATVIAGQVMHAYENNCNRMHGGRPALPVVAHFICPRPRYVFKGRRYTTLQLHGGGGA